MSLHQYLDLSTGHLSEKEMEALDDASPDSLFCGSRVVTHTYGAWVHVPEVDDEEEEGERARLYPNLHAALLYARKCHAMWINFDQDGDYDDALPVVRSC